jgi:predicted aspartyl protease
VDFRVIDDKVIVKARVNGGRAQDFVLDTGSELTTISRQTASSAVVRPDHLHAQRRASAKSACAACSWAASTRSRSARSS